MERGRGKGKIHKNILVFRLGGSCASVPSGLSKKHNKLERTILWGGMGENKVAIHTIYQPTTEEIKSNTLGLKLLAIVGKPKEKKKDQDTKGSIYKKRIQTKFSDRDL